MLKTFFLVCEVPVLENNVVLQNEDGPTPLPNIFELDTPRNIDFLDYGVLDYEG